MPTSPMGTGAGDYNMLPANTIAQTLTGFFATASGSVEVQLFAGTSGDPDEIPLTGKIHMKVGVPYQFKDEDFNVPANKGVWLLRNTNEVHVEGFVTYE